MTSGNKVLIFAGICSIVISILHIAIIIGGADWYRFFGAGEEMAVMAESSSLYPASLTMVIAIVFGLWGSYALSGAGLIRKLPLIKLALVLISSVYLLRGLAGIPLIMFIDHPYFEELNSSMTFMLVSSALSILFGVLYTIGTVKCWHGLSKVKT